MGAEPSRERGTTMDNTMLDRRSFVKGAAAAGAAAMTAGVALAGEAPSQDAAPEADAAPAPGPMMMGSSMESTAVDVSGAPAGYQCREDWLGEPPQIAPDEIVATYECDVVVCGGGHSGTQCALAAAQGGAEVYVLDSQAKDSFSYFGDDICSYNSQFLTDRGFGGYDVGEICAEYVRRGCGRVDPELLRKFVEGSGDMLDNMVAQVPETSNVFDFDGGQCQVQTAYEMPDASYYPLVREGFKAWATTIQTIGTKNEAPVVGREGVSRLTEVELYCADASQKLGATWLYETTALVLVQDETGRVTGVIGEGPDGYVQVNARKAVCLCTGDFGGNPDMVYNLLNDVDEPGMRQGQDRSAMTGPGRTGQGHKMGCWAGGFIEEAPRPSMNTMGGNPGPWGTTPYLMFNAKGKRFMDEGMAGFIAPLARRQPLGPIAVVTDANWLEGVKNAGLDHGAPNWGAAGVDVYGFMDRLQEEMEAVPYGPEGGNVGGVAIINVTMQMGSTVYKAETLDELLDYLGYEGEAKATALATIEQYNAMCEAGADTQYGKDPLVMSPIVEPPFYGAVTQNRGTSSSGLVTLAGLVTDENMNVLQADNTTPIPGLYAAGNCLGHRFGPGYATPSAGASMGMAMTHGRVLGKYVAAL